MCFVRALGTVAFAFFARTACCYIGIADAIKRLVDEMNVEDENPYLQSFWHVQLAVCIIYVLGSGGCGCVVSGMAVFFYMRPDMTHV